MNHNVDVLARLMAAEDISVIHDSDARTASFDPVNRILRFPVFNNKMSKNLYIGFTAHETGHSLFTPVNGSDLFKKYNKSLVNIVEDIRIEKMVKAKFPGSKRFFNKMYKELVSDFDFFGTKKSFDISDRSFADRLNIAFKLGESVVINSWSDKEQVIVDFLKNMRSFDDTEIGVKMILDFLKQENQPEPEDQHQDGLDQGDEGQEVPYESDSEDNESEESEESDSEDNDSEESEECDSDDSEESDSEESEDNDSEESDSDSEDGESDSEDGESDDSVNYFSPETSDEELDIESVGESEEIFGQFIDVGAVANEFSFPADKDIYLDNCVLNDGYIKEKIKNYSRLNFKTVYTSDDIINRMNARWLKFNKDSKPMVAHLVSTFERKKSASNSRRSSIKKTGKLNVNRLAHYKFSEDIFLGRETIKDGKNHGFVFFVDFSQSMCDRFSQVVKQILILTRFAKKCGLPFKVFTFTSSSGGLREYRKNYSGKKSLPLEMDINNSSRALIIEVLSSDMSNSDFSKMSEILFKWSNSFNIRNYYNPDGLNFPVGGTPTIPTMAKSSRIISDFKKKFKVEVCNVMYFTDGQNTQNLDFYERADSEYCNDLCPFDWGQNIRFKSVFDKQTKKHHSLDYYRDNHNMYSSYDRSSMYSFLMMDLIADRHNANVIYFFMSDKKSLYEQLRSFKNEVTEEMIKECKSSITKFDFGKIKFGKYVKDSIFMADDISVTSNLDLNNVESKKLKTAFRKGIKKSNSSKLFANTLIDLVIE